MPKHDADLIFESYFHSLQVDEARGRKKQFSNRVKQIITDPTTNEQRLETYYEMMKRIRSEMNRSDDDDESDTPVDVTTTVDEPESPLARTIDDSSHGFNFHSTLTLGDKYEEAPTDSMTQDVIQYLSNEPATGVEVVKYLVDKGVDEKEARNKVASMTLLDVLQHYFPPSNDEPVVPKEIDLGEVDVDPDSQEDLDTTISSFLPSKKPVIPKKVQSEEDAIAEFRRKMAEIREKARREREELAQRDAEIDSDVE